MRLQLCSLAGRQLVEFVLGPGGVPGLQDDGSVRRVKPRLVLHLFGRGFSSFAAMHPYFISSGTSEPLHADSPLTTVHVPSQITEWGLYLGTHANAQDEHLLRLLGISMVVNLTDNINSSTFDGIELVQFPTRDDEHQIMLEAWESTLDAVLRAFADGKKVLVHCQAGRSRSASAIIYCLIRAGGIALEEALAYTRRCRQAAEPNPGFMDQLRAVALSEKCHEAFTSVGRLR